MPVVGCDNGGARLSFVRASVLERVHRPSTVAVMTHSVHRMTNGVHRPSTVAVMTTIAWENDSWQPNGTSENAVDAE